MTAKCIWDLGLLPGHPADVNGHEEYGGLCDSCYSGFLELYKDWTAEAQQRLLNWLYRDAKK